MNNTKWQKYIRADIIKDEEHGMDAVDRIRDVNFLFNNTDFKNKKILDIGCEEGIILAAIQKVIKCDATGLTMKICNKLKQEVKMVEGDMHELPFDDESFDIVLIMHTLEHSIAPYIVLTEIHRVLKPGGEIMIVMPEEGDNNTSSQQHYMVLTFRQLFNLLYKTNFMPKYSLRKVYTINEYETRKDIIAVWKKNDKQNDLSKHIIPILCNKIVSTDNVNYFAVKEFFISTKNLTCNFLGSTDSLK